MQRANAGEREEGFGSFIPDLQQSWATVPREKATLGWLDTGQKTPWVTPYRWPWVGDSRVRGKGQSRFSSSPPPSWLQWPWLGDFGQTLLVLSATLFLSHACGCLVAARPGKGAGCWGPCLELGTMGTPRSPRGIGTCTPVQSHRPILGDLRRHRVLQCGAEGTWPAGGQGSSGESWAGCVGHAVASLGPLGARL